MGNHYSHDKGKPISNTLFKHHERKKRKNPLLNTDQHFTDQLGSVQIKELKAAFTSVAGGKEWVDREELGKVFKKIADDEYSTVPNSYASYAPRLFKVFDINNDKKVDIDEFLTGMAVLCEGEMEDKLEVMFQAFKDGNNPFITRGGMYAMLKSAYTRAVEILEMNVSESDSPKVQRLKNNITNTVREMVEEAFLAVDSDGNQVITFDEFTEWAKTNPVVCASLGESSDYEAEVSLL